MTGRRELVDETKKHKKWWLIGVIAVSALALGFAGVCAAAASGNTILPHTYVAGQDVGGMTVTEAARAIEPSLERLRTESGVRTMLESGEEAAYLTYDELGASFDAAALAAAAYDSGHAGSFFGDGWSLLLSWFGVSDAVSPEPEDGWQEHAAEKLAAAAGLTAEDFSYEVEEDALKLTKAQDGRSVDRLTLKARLDDADADDSGARSVDLPYMVVAADHGDLNALSEKLGGEVANASYDAETNTIIPERAAVNFNVAQAQMLLDAAAPGETVTVPATAEKPEVTAEVLKDVLFRDVLGTYTTRVGGAAGRRANVKLTAERVNGFVMNSGEEFNYYTLCGPFSKANGYQSAPGYLRGKTVDMDGGGACQCSSTTYAAALTANLEIVARTAHGFASDYIGLGLDATVSGGGPDFIFRNNTAYPIKIETVYGKDHRLTVNILGTKTDDTYVKMRSVVLSSTPYAEEFVETHELAPGQTKVEQTPYTGYVVDTYRELYDGKGNLISSDYETRSRYKVRNRVTLVGAGAAEATDGEAAETAVPAETEARVEQPAASEDAPIMPVEEEPIRLVPETTETTETTDV